MHHFIIVHDHIDGPQGVTDFLHFRGVVSHRHIPLSNIVELLTKLQLTSRDTRGENLFQIFPGLLRRLRVSDMSEQLIGDTDAKQYITLLAACSQAEESLCVASGVASLAPST